MDFFVSSFFFLIMSASLYSLVLSAALSLATALSALAQTNSSPTDSSLQQRLDRIKENYSKRMTAEQSANNEKNMQDIASTGVLQRALKVGDKAPTFALPNAKGGSTSLATLLQRGPVVLTFYRGGWCPFCNLQLRAMQQYWPEFRKMNAMLVAVSPQMPDSSMKTIEKNSLQFEVVSDMGNKTAKEYGVVYTLPEKMRVAYQSTLQRYGGAEGLGELPIAATYVISQSGMITFAYLDADYRKRAEPTAILQHLKEQAQKKQ
jgi:peroxiredoxin